MKIYILFGQRKESYPGEFAPSALSVIDEFAYDESPEYIIGRKKFYSELNEYASLEIVAIETGGDGLKEIKSRLCGDLPSIGGRIA